MSATQHENTSGGLELYFEFLSIKYLSLPIFYSIFILIQSKYHIGYWLNKLVFYYIQVLTDF